LYNFLSQKKDKKMISKELLSEVLNYSITAVEADIDCIKNRIDGRANIGDIAYRNIEWKLINIHELAHKCKEWAFNEKFILKSSLNECSITEMQFEEDWSRMEDWYRGSEESHTEPEAIFKVCQWILDNKDKKDG
jgi:hypothetical protein